ncbi:MAG: methionyl-tRNA formyltransferase [Elusimicrobiota bacterium]
MKVIFWGTSEISVPFLARLVDREEVAAVVTKPDAFSGRGHQKQLPAVKVFAQSRGIKIFQPENLKEGSFSEGLKSLAADLCLVVSYGKIIPETVLKIPRLGFINLHFSLLPKYRGAAPMQWTIIKGEQKTGVTSFWLDAGLDSGPIILQKETEILPEDNYLSLQERLIVLGMEAMEETLVLLGKNSAPKIVQQGEVSFAPPLKKEDGKIDWNRPAKEIVNLVRGTYPWPGAFSYFKDKKGEARLIKIIAAKIWDKTSLSEYQPGQVAVVDKGQGFVIKSIQGEVLVTKVQPEGKKELTAWNFWQGARLQVGDFLGQV